MLTDIQEAKHILELHPRHAVLTQTPSSSESVLLQETVVFTSGASCRPEELRGTGTSDLQDSHHATVAAKDEVAFSTTMGTELALVAS